MLRVVLFVYFLIKVCVLFEDKMYRVVERSILVLENSEYETKKNLVKTNKKTDISVL